MAEQNPNFAASIERVQPGELISADFVNRIIDKLNNLESRIAKLENADKRNQSP